MSLWSRRRVLAVLGSAVGLVPRGAAQEEVLPWADIEEGGPIEGAPSARVRFTDLSRQAGALTPTDSFFLLHHGEIPEIDAARWRLAFDGGVERPVSHRLDDLMGREKVTLDVCVECAGNGGVGMHGLVGNARWAGVRLASLLKELGVSPQAKEVVFWGADEAYERLRGNRYPTRFARSLPLADALDDNVLLVYEMNGKPLAPEHGFPLRLIAPGWYGVTQVKWLTHIEVIDHRFMGWFMAKDYVTLRGERDERGSILHRASSVGRQRLKSIITRVNRASGASDTLRIQGFAWSDGTPITSVEVQIDDGPFLPAELETPASPFAWAPFHLPWRAPSPGRHRLVSRARDQSGRVQPTKEQGSRYKATPWENNGQVVRTIDIA